MHSLSSWVSDLAYSQTISRASRFSISHCNSTKSLCAQDYTSWFILTCNFWSALVDIRVNTSWIWLNSFEGVYPTISSIYSILGVIWNVVFGCGSEWIGYHSSSSTLSIICGVDGSGPLLLLVFCTSPICLRSCHMSASSS
jgi:hypothetical protein